MKLLTPPGVAGIAVLRAGTGERAALLRLLRRGDGQAVVLRPGDPPRRAALQVDGVVVDDVLVVDRGERGVELHVHGAPATVDALRRVFVVEGACPSSYAEQLLWQAITRAQMELALEQMAFDFDACCASLQAQPLSERSLAVAAMQERTRVARAHVEPRRLVLVGAQNAGKSSLCNTLLFRERVLTGPQPGLTRDPVAECTGLVGYPYELVDAAGGRQHPRRGALAHRAGHREALSVARRPGMRGLRWS